MINKATTNNATTNADDDSAHQLHLGFERVRAAVLAVPKNDLEQINLGVGGVVQTVLGTIPEVQALRAELAKLGTFDMSYADNLRDYALALGHTHSRHRIATGTPDTSLVKELVATRERFHAHASVFVHHGVLDAARVNALRSGNSHQGLGYDVIGLCDLFLANWAAIGERSMLEQAEIEQARLSANRLINVLGHKEQGPGANHESALLRQQAYTLVLRAYNEVRAAIAFVRRHEGDVDDITPSLYARRGKPGSSDDTWVDDEPVESDDVQEQLDEGDNLNAAVAQAFAAPKAPGGNGADQTPAAPANPAPPGFPGARPLGDG